MGTLEGRVAVVTGAARGIGYAIARRLGAEGAAVVVNDVDAGALERSCAELAAGGARVAAAPGSVASPADAEAIVACAEREFGGLDLLVNNAGITRDAPLHKMTDEQWNLVISVALTGAFNLCRASARLLRPARGERHERNKKVVNITSINGIYGIPGNANYSAAKAGLIGFTKSLAREWARSQVNVNAVAPGYIAGTRLTSARDEDSGLGIPAEAIGKIEALIPIGRAGQPEDVAGVVAFLCSADADYLTGQVIELHGGLELVPLQA